MLTSSLLKSKKNKAISESRFRVLAIYFIGFFVLKKCLKQFPQIKGAFIQLQKTIRVLSLVVLDIYMPKLSKTQVLEKRMQRLVNKLVLLTQF